ncbi:MAG: hypothetical protein NZ534_00615 [Bacteroidia bacterium]|nr:hypothetical protein [Bacteroidia bacterium]
MKIEILAATVWLMCTVRHAMADHIAGADLTYRCLGNGQYEISLTVYRDCSGIPLDAENLFWALDAATGQVVLEFEAPLQNIQEYDPSAMSGCAVTDPNVCYEIGTYTFVVNLPPKRQRICGALDELLPQRGHLQLAIPRRTRHRHFILHSSFRRRDVQQSGKLQSMAAAIFVRQRHAVFRPFGHRPRRRQPRL